MRPSSQRKWLRAVLLSVGGLAVVLAVISLARWTRPTPPTAVSQLDPVTAAPCRSVGTYGNLLVVDLEDYERADIETAMRVSIPVVAYDCNAFRVLHGCSVASKNLYGFMAFSRKEAVVRLEDTDQVRANLPALGDSLAGKLTAELSHGSTLDVATIMVGKKSTTTHVTRDMLRGGAACNGATHFVSGAFLGAFAMGLGTKGQASALAGVFSGAAQSSKVSRHRDGQPDTCAQVHEGAASAPETCDALVRLEVLALDAPIEHPSEGNQQANLPTCREGFVWSGEREGKCLRPTSEGTHACVDGDVADCTAQCKRWDPDSCNTLGLMYMNGHGVARADGQAAELFEKACDNTPTRGCNNLGLMYKQGRGVPHDNARARLLFTKACDAGVALACVNLGQTYAKGEGVDQDNAKAAELYRRACDGGAALGCASLGFALANGAGVPKDDEAANALYRRACDAAVVMGCLNLAIRHETGRGIAQENATAIAFYEKTCKLGDARGCNALKRLQPER